jgi:uncharacterized protein YlbG (UPF0298 family)
VGKASSRWLGDFGNVHYSNKRWRIRSWR